MEETNAKETPARKKSVGQMSESFLTVAFLSLSGGLQDAYTYFSRGKVFANAQTGNVILLSQGIFEQDGATIVRYLIPLLSFAFGVAACEGIRSLFSNRGFLHWRQVVLIAEIALLFAVSFLPDTLDVLANALVSFSCAMQVQAFRKVEGHPFASTMCIGNLRSGVDALCSFARIGKKSELRKAFCYFALIVLFGLGAGMGGSLIAAFGFRTIWISCLLLLIAFGLMFFGKGKKEKR